MAPTVLKKLLSYVTLLSTLSSLLTTQQVELDDYALQKTNTIVQFDVQMKNSDDMKQNANTSLILEGQICDQFTKAARLDLRSMIDCSFTLLSVSDVIDGQILAIVPHYYLTEYDVYNNEEDFGFLLNKSLGDKGTTMTNYKLIQLGKQEAFFILDGLMAANYSITDNGGFRRINPETKAEFVRLACDQTKTQLKVGNKQLSHILQECWTSIRSESDYDDKVEQFVFFSYNGFLRQVPAGSAVDDSQIFVDAFKAGQHSIQNPVFIDIRFDATLYDNEQRFAFSGTLIPSNLEWNEDYRLSVSKLYINTENNVKIQLSDQLEAGDKQIGANISFIASERFTRGIYMTGVIGLILTDLVNDEEIVRRLNAAYQKGRETHSDKWIQNVQFTISNSSSPLSTD